jgi:ketosteroid isomerase-like protein
MTSTTTDETAMRERIAEHFAFAGKDEAAAAQIFADDAVIEWPQSGERIRGKPQIIALHEASPVKIDFEIRRIVGNGDLWVTETTIRYDGGRPTKAVFIMEFRDGLVVRETDYFGEPFDPPDYRATWVELMSESER